MKTILFFILCAINGMIIAAAEVPMFSFPWWAFVSMPSIVYMLVASKEI